MKKQTNKETKLENATGIVSNGKTMNREQLKHLDILQLAGDVKQHVASLVQTQIWFIGFSARGLASADKDLYYATLVDFAGELKILEKISTELYLKIMGNQMRMLP